MNSIAKYGNTIHKESMDQKSKKRRYCNLTDIEKIF